MDRRPPGPPTPFLGLREIQRIKADTVGYYTALQKQYGDAVYLRLGWFDDYTFFHPEQVREVLVTKAKAFPKMAHQVRVFAQWNGRHSILLSEGDEWLRVRRLAQPAFHARRLAGYATAFVDAARRFAEQWGREGGPREVTAAMTDLSLEIAARTLFGLDLAAEARA